VYQVGINKGIHITVLRVICLTHIVLLDLTSRMLCNESAGFCS